MCNLRVQEHLRVVLAGDNTVPLSWEDLALSIPPEGPLYPVLPGFFPRKPPPEGWLFPPPRWGHCSILM